MQSGFVLVACLLPACLLMLHSEPIEDGERDRGRRLASDAQEADNSSRQLSAGLVRGLIYHWVLVPQTRGGVLLSEGACSILLATTRSSSPGVGLCFTFNGHGNTRDYTQPWFAC